MIDLFDIIIRVFTFGVIDRFNSGNIVATIEAILISLLIWFTAFKFISFLKGGLDV